MRGSFGSLFAIEHLYLWPDGKVQRRFYNQDDVGRLASRITACLRTSGTTRVTLFARTVPKRLTTLKVWTSDPTVKVSFLDENGPSVSESEILEAIAGIEHPGPAGRYPGQPTQQVLF